MFFDVTPGNVFGLTFGSRLDSLLFRDGNVVTEPMFEGVVGFPLFLERNDEPLPELWGIDIGWLVLDENPPKFRVPVFVVFVAGDLWKLFRTPVEVFRERFDELCPRDVGFCRLLDEL